jgi:tRNA threonylcarbamoyladenosine biosynthesis protein TsaE
MKNPKPDELLAEGEVATEGCGRGMAKAVFGGQCIYLFGDLGAGKTTFVRGLLRGLGVTENITSPTFTIMNEYRVGPLKVLHLDLYRLEDPEELEFLGLRDLFDDSTIMLVEWPERGSGFLPPADRDVILTYVDEGHRRIVCS